jgi:uncharacterized protein (DUF697 family)
VVSTKKLPVAPTAVLGVMQGLRASARQERPVVVAGPPGLVSLLAADLRRGGVDSMVREQGPLEGASLLIIVLAGEPTADDELLLRDATRARLPLIAVVPGTRDASAHVPYVLDANLVRVESGTSFPIDEIALRVGRVLGESATPLAARLPVLREAVCEELIRKFSRRNALVGAVVFIPGADLPIMTVNQIRLVLRIADAHGFEIDRERLPEVLAVIGSAFGFRALARKTIGLVPLVGWAVKGAFGYTGTRAIGEAAVPYFERRAPVTKIAGDRVRFPA